LIDQGVNQAHNGYLEVFLNLGWVGVALLTILLLYAYRRIINDFRWKMQETSLLLGYFIVAINYNFTEAGFKMMHPVWITFLLAAMAVRDVPPLEELRSPDLDNADDLVESNQEVTTFAAPARRQSAHRLHREDRLRTG
jgi:O-antigen ligase